MNNEEDNAKIYRRSKGQQDSIDEPDKSKHLQHRLDKAILLVVVLIVITYLILFLV